jgi:hypothetical protein
MGGWTGRPASECRETWKRARCSERTADRDVRIPEKAVRCRPRKCALHHITGRHERPAIAHAAVDIQIRNASRSESAAILGWDRGVAVGRQFALVPAAARTQRLGSGVTETNWE